MDKRKTKDRLISITTPIAFFVLACAIWELTVRLAHVPVYILPPPSVIFFEIVNENVSLLENMGVTMLEAVSGFAVANVMAFGVAALFAHSRVLEKGLYPYAITLKTTPIVALAPLLVLWFGTDIRSKIVSAALISFFPVLVNATRGLRTVDEEALDLFESLAATKWQVFKLLRFPNSLPYIFSALKVSTSLSIVGAIVGEFVGSKSGLGNLILEANFQFDVARIFAVLVVLALFGVVLSQLMRLAQDRLLFWNKTLTQ